MSIEEQQKCVIPDWFTFKTKNIDSIATQEHADTANKRRRPLFLAHLAPTGIEPHHIPDLRTSYPATLKKFRAAKYGMRVAKPNQLSCELQKLIVLFIARPIEPTDLVVLAISVVVSVLCPVQLVSTTEHRHALGKKKCGQEIPALPFAQGIDLRIFGSAFGATIPR